MYEHINYEGSQFNCGIGKTSYDALSAQNWNDKASSIKIPAGLRAIFYEHAGEQVRRLELGPGDYPNLVNLGWNDLISSVNVQQI
jgi:hypothetical protein